MPTVFLTGASRGLGVEFARQYAADGWRVLASCRDPEAARELAGIGGDVAIHRLDVTDGERVAALAGELDGEAIDLLINNAGVIGAKSRASGRVDYEEWRATLEINAIAPVRVSEAFLPHLERGGKKLLVSISSIQGSVGAGAGGGIVYGTSKAALNHAMNTLAGELRGRGITVVLLHPGWVATDMGRAGAPLTPAQSVGAMRTLIARLVAGACGKFLGYDGKEIPW